MKKIYHPLLISLLPILAFYSHNKNELTSGSIIFPMIIILVFSGLYYLVLRKLVKDELKAKILTSTNFILFYSFGHLMIYLRERELLQDSISSSSYLIWIWIFLLFLTGLIIIRSKKSFSLLNEFFNIFSAALLLILIADIGYFEINRKPWGKFLEKENIKSGNNGNYCRDHNCPDVYYIIVERYGNQEILKERFAFDNGEFISYLENRGFVVPEKSRSNYLTTPPSLASSLNMDYLDDLAEVMGENNIDRGPLFEMYRDNKIWRFFKSKGYKYIFVGSYWEQGEKSPYADINYRFDELGLSQFSRSFLETTMLYPVVNNIAKNPYLNLRNIEHNLSIDQIDKLIEFSKIKEPKYIFAHLFITHGPYVFDQNGKLISEEEEKKSGYLKNYINSIIFANKKLKNMIMEIQKNSGNRAIILLQADEGPYPEKFFEDHFSFDWRKATNLQMKVKTGILNAYFLPSAGKSPVYPAITPVNTFRLVMNLYFGEQFQLLPDRTFAHEDYQHPYKFFEITDKIK